MKRTRTRPTPIRLPAVLDMQAAAPLAQSFLERRGQAVSVDGTDVQRLGGQCLQVLLSAQASWAADGKEFVIIGQSEAMADALGTLGAAALLPIKAGEIRA